MVGVPKSNLTETAVFQVASFVQLLDDLIVISFKHDQQKMSYVA